MKLLKDVKNQAMGSESHNPAALVSVVSLKCVLRVAVRLELKSVVTGYFEHHGQY